MSRLMLSRSEDPNLSRATSIRIRMLGVWMFGFLVGSLLRLPVYLNLQSLTRGSSKQSSSKENNFVAVHDDAHMNNHDWETSNLVSPLQHTDHVTFKCNHKKGDKDCILMDVFNPFHVYMSTSFPGVPLWHSWIPYFEAYHNHMARFRGKKLVFMEVGIQSGGKIPLMRQYFGNGLEYVGIDINPSTKMFESADWVHVEIGDSGDPEFWKQIKLKYPHVDIFLDDGGHTMGQQTTTMREMLPHVQQEGVYLCEDLSTSWASEFGGIPYGNSLDPIFVNTTAVGLVYRTMDWFMAGFARGIPCCKEASMDSLSDDLFPGGWWRVVLEQVKHIHYYNQLVVYEKGLKPTATTVKTGTLEIPYKASGDHDPVNWDYIMKKVDDSLKHAK